MTIGSGLAFIGVALACVGVAYFDPFTVTIVAPIGFIVLAICHE
jgi:hypothetical protein